MSMSSSTAAVASGQASQNILLDPDIRDWVVLPLLVIMISAGLLRAYMGQLLKAKSNPINPIEYQVKSCLGRTSRLRSGAGSFLSRSKWEGRVRFFSEKQQQGSSSGTGYLYKQAEWAEDQEAKSKASGADPMNPMAMLDGMKGNMAFMVQNMVMMQGISYFFSGFVLLKVPFPLTNGFKMMFQRGLDLTSLETSYVSSVSWYFLVMFGLRAFFRLVMGEPKPDVMDGHSIQFSLGCSNASSPPGQQFKSANALKAEADNLEMSRCKSCIDDAEKRLLGSRYPKKARISNKGNDIFGIERKGGTTRKKKQ